MPVSVGISFSGGTPAERQAIIDTILVQHPKPPGTPLTDSQWAQQVIVDEVQRLIEDAAEFDARQKLTTARARAVRVERG